MILNIGDEVDSLEGRLEGRLESRLRNPEGRR
jgi:hypothetical protein